MKDTTRRSFLGKLLTGVGVSLLSLLPGSFFFKGKAIAADVKRKALAADTLETVLPKINRSNIGTMLPKAALSQEDKVAIAAITEIPPADLKASIAKMKSGKGIDNVAGGAGCGGGCNGWGLVCGAGCHPGPDTVGAFDPQGKLGINMKGINKATLLKSLDKASALPR